MKYVKWIFVIIFISSLSSFAPLSRPMRGLDMGDLAPDFMIPASDRQLSLRDLKGKYVLLSFWAGYDASSRMQNTALNHLIRRTRPDIEMVSVSFDEYRSVFNETIRKDRLASPYCFVDTAGHRSSLFKKYHLQRGFVNYLLDSDGVIIAKNVTPNDLIPSSE